MKSKLFIGFYKERRLFEEINSYRDVITIHKSETQMIAELSRLEHIAKSLHGNNYWCGFSTNKQELYCDTSLNIPFGSFWFQIKKIKIHSTEIELKLKVCHLICTNFIKFRKTN